MRPRTAILICEESSASIPSTATLRRLQVTGLAAVAGGMFENLFSGLFLILFLLFLAVFFTTGRLGNKTLRILFFWVPTIAACVFTAGSWVLVAYAIRHIPHQ